VPSLRKRGHDLVSQRRPRTLTRPGIREELHERERLAHREIGRDRHASEVGSGFALALCAGRPCDDVIHSGCHSELAAAGRVDEHDTEPVL
jgi:hypothetical protein